MQSEIQETIAGRYSSALFELAEQGKALDDVASDLKTLRGMIAESEDFRRMIRSPVLTRTEQKKAVLALAQSAKFGSLTANFLGVLGQNRRLFALDAIATDFLDRLAAKRGEVTAEVSAATPLSEAQLEAVAEILKKYAGRKVSLDTKVDPDLLGGLVVRIGSRMVDASLKTKLQHLKLAMKGIG